MCRGGIFEIAGLGEESQPVESFARLFFRDDVLVDEVGLRYTVMAFRDVRANARARAQHLLRHHALALLAQMLAEPHNPKRKRLGLLKKKISSSAIHTSSLILHT